MTPRESPGESKGTSRSEKGEEGGSHGRRVYDQQECEGREGKTKQ